MIQVGVLALVMARSSPKHRKHLPVVSQECTQAWLTGFSATLLGTILHPFWLRVSIMVCYEGMICHRHVLSNLPTFEGLARLREVVSRGTLQRSVSRRPTPCTRSRARCRCPGCPCRGRSSSSGVAL